MQFSRIRLSALIRLARPIQEWPEATALVALARIDPENPAVIPYLKMYFVAGERESLNGPYIWISEDVLEVVWELGSRAEPLVADLQMVLASPLLDQYNRCRAAYALAAFPQERSSAVRYLERVAGDNDWSGAPRLLEKLKALGNQGR